MNQASSPRDIVTLLRDAAHRDPGVEAFVEAGGRRITFAEWDARADGLAAGLQDHGVEPGHVVCLLLPSCIEYMIAYQAVVRLGAVVSGVNLRLGRAELDHIFSIARPQVSIVEEDRADLPERAGSVVSWSSLAAWCEAPPPTLPRLDPNRTMLLCWTGGTTGRPRGAAFDHDNLAAVARGTGVLSAPYDRRLSPIPFAHVGTMTRAWDEISRRITTVITPPAWSAAGALSLIAHEQVTVAQGVPTQWELILRDGSFETTDISSLRLAGIGGAAVTPDLLARMRRQLGVPVVNRYAATEAGGLISGTRPDDPDDVVTQTVGRASEGVEIRIVDDRGVSLPPGQIGLVQVRSAAVMRGYWRDNEATAQVIDDDGWLLVGDIGRLDDAGNLTLVGRKGDMYVRGGYNVYPVEVERRLAEHPSIAQVAVVAVADAVLGEIGVAVVVPDDGATPTLEEVRAWTVAELADYKAPDRLVLLDALPLTSIGKVDRRALADVASSDPPAD